MTCAEVVVRLGADMDGELAESESLEVGRHLLSCVECARKRTLLEQTRLAFRSDGLGRPRAYYARSFAASAALTLAVGFGVIVARAPIPSSRAADAGPLIGIDCGRPGAECVVEQPCQNSQCSADQIVPGLR